MICADDTQLYLVLDSCSDGKLQRLEDCVRGVKAWTAENRLLLNDSKTEVLHLSSRFTRNPTPISTIKVGDCDVDIASEVRNLGVIFDQHMTFISQVDKVCRAASLAISKIGRIRKYIDRPTAERLVHAFVTSKLDANNSLLLGLPSSAISKLQRVQNSAVRLVLGVGGHRVNINDLRRNELHWLPVKDRIGIGLTPPYLKELLKHYKPSRSLQSSMLSLLEVPRTVSTSMYGERVSQSLRPSCGLSYHSNLEMLNHLPPSRNSYKLIFLITQRFNTVFLLLSMVPSWADVFSFTSVVFSLPSVRAVRFFGGHGFCCSFLHSSADWASCIYVQFFRLFM